MEYSFEFGSFFTQLVSLILVFFAGTLYQYRRTVRFFRNAKYVNIDGRNFCLSPIEEMDRYFDLVIDVGHYCDINSGRLQISDDVKREMELSELMSDIDRKVFQLFETDLSRLRDYASAVQKEIPIN